MMKMIRAFGILLALAWSGAALAQSTALPTENGMLTVTGCGGSSNSTLPCFLPGKLDACQTQPHSYVPVSITSATSTNVIAGAASKKTYICHIFLFASAADNVAVVEATTGTSCATAVAGVIGGATAANGMVLPTASSFTQGNGANAVAGTATANDDVCLITSSAGPLAGVIVYAQQ